MKILRTLTPRSGRNRWLLPMNVVWYTAVGADGQVAGASTALGAAVALRAKRADSGELWGWRNAFDEDERTEITRRALARIRF